MMYHRYSAILRCPSNRWHSENCAFVVDGLEMAETVFDFASQNGFCRYI
jgi:hypothetical protein